MRTPTRARPAHAGVAVDTAQYMYTARYYHGDGQRWDAARYEKEKQELRKAREPEGQEKFKLTCYLPSRELGENLIKIARMRSEALRDGRLKLLMYM